MLRRTFLASSGIASLMAGASLADEQASADVLSVEIALGKRAGGFRALEYRDANSHFPLVLRNLSREPVRVWREWCSWGYFAASFVAVAADGTQSLVKKRDREWGKNFPDFDEIGPGESIVRDIYFGSDDWENFPRRTGSGGHAIKLKAIFAIEPDGDAKKHRVWTGKVRSPEIEVTVFGF